MTSDVLTIPLDEKGQAVIPSGYENKGLVQDESGKTYILAVKSGSGLTQTQAITSYNTGTTQQTTTTTQTERLPLGYSAFESDTFVERGGIINTTNSSITPTSNNTPTASTPKEERLPLGYSAFDSDTFVQNGGIINTQQTQVSEISNRALISTPERDIHNLGLPSYSDLISSGASNIITFFAGSKAGQRAFDFTKGLTKAIGLERKWSEFGSVSGYSPVYSENYMIGEIVGISANIGIWKGVGNFFSTYSTLPIEAQTIQVTEGKYTISATSVRTGGGSITSKSIQQLISSEGNKFVYSSAIDDVAKSGRSITIGYVNKPKLTTYSYSSQGVSEGLFDIKQGKWLDFSKGSMTGKGYRIPTTIISTTTENLRSTSGLSGTQSIISGQIASIGGRTISSLVSGSQAVTTTLSNIPKFDIKAVSTLIGVGASRITRTKNNLITRTKPVMMSSTITKPAVITTPISKIRSIPSTRTFSPPATRSTPKTITTIGTITSQITISSSSAPKSPVMPARNIPFRPVVPVKLPSVDLKLGGGSRGRGLNLPSFGKRKYSYSPSLGAIVFNVKKFGSEPKRLTGLELRPIMLGKKRKQITRKKKRRVLR